MYLLENVAASSFSRRSSFRSFIIVSETMLFSVSYLDLRLERATWKGRKEWGLMRDSIRKNKTKQVGFKEV